MPVNHTTFSVDPGTLRPLRQILAACRRPKLVPLLAGQPLNRGPLFWHYPHYGNQGGDPSAGAATATGNSSSGHQDGARAVQHSRRHQRTPQPSRRQAGQSPRPRRQTRRLAHVGRRQNADREHENGPSALLLSRLFWLFWGTKKGDFFWRPPKKSRPRSEGTGRGMRAALPRTVLSLSPLAPCGRGAGGEGFRWPAGVVRRRKERGLFWGPRQKSRPRHRGGPERKSIPPNGQPRKSLAPSLS